MLIRIIKDWNWPDIFRQTPNNNKKWDGINFTEEPVDECDYIIVCNRLVKDVSVKCNPSNIFKIIQEPPVKEYKWLRKDFDQYGVAFIPDITVKRPNVIHSHGALSWHINKDYDFLKRLTPIKKTKDLSWITSNAKARHGHRKRIDFLNYLKTNFQFDLFGKGFNFIEDKWQGLVDYKYSIAVENHSSFYYWTEKIIDCYLSWTMPIYYGCKNILDFFPKESLILIDINNRKESLKIIKDSIRNNIYEKNIKAIAYARELILNRYQFFPFFVNYIKNNHSSNKLNNDAIEKNTIILKRLDWQYKGDGDYYKMIKNNIKKFIKMILKKLGLYK